MIRINEEIKKELSDIIRQDLKDPRIIQTMVSVLNVDTTNDLKYCKIYISVMGNEEQKKGVIEGLKNASGFIRREIARRINLRNTPELIFKIDDSIEYGIRLSKIIDDIKSNTEEEDESNE
ncbi:30S ribosome-binding factor RbfA [Defluviitalea raffinosedens]|uniref:Ribosome-binding factor A n=2 Tax=Defluviitalea raffinosedens TaxID=1450156 RepID=A0A7C8LEC1_9FIRM|nr:30S ribosome-binding factor RbfA [Defluviitalea raffinosedens]KAE9637081.1 30S ribosome-binding factor RbfA [Defluviitalea raffinosedens]